MPESAFAHAADFKKRVEQLRAVNQIWTIILALVVVAAIVVMVAAIIVIARTTGPEDSRLFNAKPAEEVLLAAPKDLGQLTWDKDFQATLKTSWIDGRLSYKLTFSGSRRSAVTRFRFVLLDINDFGVIWIDVPAEEFPCRDDNPCRGIVMCSSKRYAAVSNWTGSVTW